jgi:hypothetical protein
MSDDTLQVGMLVTVECEYDHGADACRYQGRTGKILRPWPKGAWVVDLDGNDPIFDAVHLVPVPGESR